MRRRKNLAGREDEQGIIITLVAVFMLCVIGAMAALSIDLATLYTARSEAQLAADGAALAAARALANSGMTSKPTDAILTSSAETLAFAVATQVAQNNQVGGRNLVAGNGEVTISFPNVGSADFGTNPHITVQVKRTDLPTFFARIWGTTQLTVGASATAEAYNPSGGGVSIGKTALPVAPMCVKPWLLPNISPTPGGTSTLQIFDPATGAIQDPSLLGWVAPPSPIRLRTDCTTCTSASAPTVWRYYPGDPADFPPPNASSVTGSAGFTNPNFQLSVAGCIQTPISCKSIVHVDTTTTDPNLDLEAADAVDVLAHTTANEGDSVDTAALPSPPFQFVAGQDDPIVLSGAVAAGTDIMVSDSLVTVPVINVDTATWPSPGLVFPSVQIIGFVQLFLNPTGQRVPPVSHHIHSQVINLVGCGTAATGQPILGNGASPVAVRLISQ